MRLKNLIACFFLGITVASCIQDEAPNAEADIETCTVPGDVLNRDAVIENDRITLIVKVGTDITTLAPQFTLTSGASVIPASGSTLDFTNPQFYEVTSEDGISKKRYEVKVTFSGVTNTTYHFENARLDRDGKYQIFYETDAQGKETMSWASGNPGFGLTGVTGGSDVYPTRQSPNGYQGKCLALTTRKTGSLGNLVNMPLAAGNLFLGTFDVLNALTNALTSTRFGLPFNYTPTYLKGYYKFKPGDTFYVLDLSRGDKLKPVPGQKDICDFYAVFYEVPSNGKPLDGTNILEENNPNVVSIARIDNAKETDEWTSFNLPFIPQNGKTVDPEKLKAGLYNLAIVFSSSIRGAYFEGAPGSTLYIDEIELSYEE